MKSHEKGYGGLLIVSLELNNELLLIILVYALNTKTGKIIFYENHSKFGTKHCDNLSNIIITDALNFVVK